MKQSRTIPSFGNVAGTPSAFGDTSASCWRRKMGAGMESSVSRSDMVVGRQDAGLPARHDRRDRQTMTRERTRPVLHNGSTTGESLATFLGWFSIGLGLAQFLGPRRMARMVGARDDESTTALMRVLGMREIASGVGIRRYR